MSAAGDTGRARRLSAALLLVALVGCGYGFAVGGTLPAGVNRLQVEPFVDRTAEGELGAAVAAATRSALREIDVRRVAALGEQADARLVGSVEAVRQSTVPMGRGGAVVAGLYRISVEARARIVSADGRTLEDLGSFREGVEYPAESGVGAAEESRRRALVRATRAIGGRIAEAALIRF